MWLHAALVDVASCGLVGGASCCPCGWGFMLSWWMGFHVALVGGASCYPGGWGFMIPGGWGFILLWWVGLSAALVGGVSF